jgi:hypothetical protein
MSDITNAADVIDVRDIIARVEELEAEGAALDEPETQAEHAAWDASEAGEELGLLSALLEELKGNGGDEQWRGDWYPITLVRDSYFERYAQELADDIGAIDSNASWPNNCIDWERAARELQMDYTSAEYDGVTYLYR